MVDEYVSRKEFEDFKKEMLEKTENNQKLLQEIVRKIDVIAEKIATGEKIDELKLQPLTARVTKLEENHNWLSKTVAGTIIGIIIKLIFDISNYVK